MAKDYYKETGHVLNLNEFADVSPEEYERLHGAAAETSVDDTPVGQAEDQVEDTQSVRDPLGNSSTEDEDNEEADQGGFSDKVRSEYAEFCKEHDKVFDEGRLPIYAENLRLAEQHFENTGERLKLNEVRRFE